MSVKDCFLKALVLLMFYLDPFVMLDVEFVFCGVCSRLRYPT